MAAVGGRGTDPARATSAMIGGRSLRFRAALTRLDDLGEFATTAVDLARRNNYQEAFSWIDNIRPVDDQDLVRELRRQLVDELIADPGRPTVDVILPDDLAEAGEDRPIRYIVFPRERGVGPGRTELITDMVADLLSELDRGLDAELRFLDDSGERIGTATVLDCLSATLSHDLE
ncbi:MAG TPA: DUF6119 family protein [Streptosporangiaceae bacterium]|nr:DUF6119 family protein [Streptosporangiaceae bacterium]